MPPPPLLRSRRRARVFVAAGGWRRTAVAAAALVACVCSAPGCRRGRQHGAQVPSLAVAYDLRPLDAHALDAEGARRALGMPAGEVAARLKRLVAVQDVQLTLGQQGRVLLQERTASSVAFDGAGGVRASQRGTRHGFEVLAVGEKAFVRLDRGHYRGKGRRDVEVPELTEVAYSGLRQALQWFGPVQLTAPREGRVGGRPSVGYALQLQPGAASAPTQAGVLFPPGALPAVPPGAWREGARDLRLEGRVEFDAETGVVLQARLKGELSCAGPEGRPMQLSLQVRHDVSEVGRAAEVTEPAGAVAEFRRPVRPREPLAFFRDQLPAPPPP